MPKVFVHVLSKNAWSDAQGTDYDFAPQVGEILPLNDKACEVVQVVHFRHDGKDEFEIYAVDKGDYLDVLNERKAELIKQPPIKISGAF